MNQLELFENEHLARNSDPETSKEAGRHVVEKGIANREMKQILECLKRHPGCTARELQQYLDSEFPGIAADAAHKRMSKLVEKGLVRRPTERKCRVSNRKALECWPT